MKIIGTLIQAVLLAGIWWSAPLVWEIFRDTFNEIREGE